MNPFQPIAQVSALDNPLPELLQKRQFTPSSCSIFGDSRRRKLENGVQSYQNHTFQNPSNLPSCNSNFRPSFSFTSTCFTDSTELLHQGQNLKLTERQKFKARPLPKSTYKPYSMQKPIERQVTMTQEFHLTSPSPKKISDSGQVEKFKARPMPDFSKPWQPFFTPNKHKTPEPSSQNLSSSCIKHFPSFDREHRKSVAASHCKSKSKASDFRFKTQEFEQNEEKYCQSNKNFKDYKETKGFKEEKSRIDNAMDIELHSTKRAKDRELFQERLQELNRKKEADLQAEARAQAAQEELELRQIRKQAEFKARQMPNFQRVLNWDKNHDYEDQSTAFASSLNDTMMDIE